jgi:hypothetical protein
MLEITPNDASSLILQSQENVSPRLFISLPSDISRKRKLDDLEASYPNVNASTEKKKQATQLEGEATGIKSNSNPLSCDEFNEIPQDLYHLIKTRFQRNGSKSEIDEKYYLLCFFIECF